MSNPADEALLRTASHRARITTAMLGAIDGFFASQGSFTRLTG
jgi:N-acetylmuramoyl-L-alanine amidase